MSKCILQFSICVLLCLAVVSCGGGSKSNPGGGGGGGVQFTTPSSGPTIELGQSVNLTVSAPSGSTITWTLANGNGLGNPAGKLTPSGTSATYTAPTASNPQVCNGTAAPTPLQMNVTASDGTGDSATLTIVILQTSACIQTLPSVMACSTSATATTCSPYPASGAKIACPPNGTLMPLSAQVNNQLFVVGVNSSITINDGGKAGSSVFGQPPFQWSVTSGSLPAGLALVPNTTDTSNVQISGTPTAAGCSQFTLQIADSLGGKSTSPFFIAVVPPALKVQVPNIAFGYGGLSYPTTSLTVIGGTPPYSWSPTLGASNAANPNSPEDLPPNLALSFSPPGTTAVISGTINPQDVGNTINNGTYAVFFQVNDSQSPYPAFGAPSFPNGTGIQTLAPNTLCEPASPITPISGFGGSPTGGNVAISAFLNGNYAFLLHGFDANGAVVLAGSVQMDGQGNITAGEEDVTRSSGSQTVTVIPSGSSYKMGKENNRGCMTLQDSSGSTSTFAFSVGSCINNYVLSNGTIGPHQSACGIKANPQGTNVPAGLYTSGRIIEFDSSGTHLSGILRMQDTSSFSSGLSGQYAFGLNGWDSASKHYVAAGSVQAGSGSLSSAAADINDGGTVASNLTGGSGTLGSTDANGRVSGTLTVGSGSYNLAMYLVSKSEAMMATTDLLTASHPIASGEALGTQGPFGVSSLLTQQMFHLGGISGSSPDVSIGHVGFDGVSTFSGSTFEDQGGTLSTTSVAGLYAVDANTGRTFFSSPQNQNFVHPFVAYIIPPAAKLTASSCATPASCVTGFLVGTDSAVQDGVMEFQTPVTAPPPPFTNQNVQGDFTFGVDEALDSLTDFREGFANTAAAASTLTSGTLPLGVQDHDYGDPNACGQGSCTPLVPEEQFAGGYTINSSDGTGSFGGSNGDTVSITNGRIVFYIDESVTNVHPSVMVGEQ